jgi:cytochrome b561
LGVVCLRSKDYTYTTADDWKTLVDFGRSLHFWLAYTFLAFIAVHLIFQWKVAKANWRRLIGFLKARKAPKEN